MTYATSSPLHVRIPKRRNHPSSDRRIVRKALIGLTVVAITVVTMTAVLMGVGSLLALSLGTRSGIRSAVALASPSSGPAWAVPSNVGIAAQLAIVANLSPPAVRSVAPAPDPTAALTRVTPEPPDPPETSIADQDVTGSLGIYALQSTSTDIQLDRPSLGPSPRLSAKPLPLPRPRPRLVMLTPPRDLGINLQQDARFLRTAIYDITAQTVFLPNGVRLEAHSGLGRLMDDPHYVHRKDRGATPPNTYKLTLRESLFHGVRAIRLTPVSDADMFGRDGILAHSYMLGPSGQSNGCVSFRDYPKFLRAFLRGEVDRMIVVRRLDKPPTFVARRNIQSASNTF